MERLEDYNFELPQHLIAQRPLDKRENSRLLVLDRNTSKIEHKTFHNIIDYLNEGDVLVLNDSRVLPARLFGVKDSTNANIEVLMLKESNKDVWQCLVKPAKRIKIGDVVSFGNGELRFKCLNRLEDGLIEFKLDYEGILLETLEKLGTMPLPPYIKEKLSDQERYQTVYSKIVGSAAAPTAGLHFSKDLLKKITEKKVKLAYVTLHVGLATFKPVSIEDITKHKMHSEYYILDDINAKIINEAISDNKKIFSVGTTSTRTLESIYKEKNAIVACSGFTDIFIYPGFKFNVIDHQLTNFHLPKSTLMMLISAFSTKDLIMKAYEEAIKEEYRFFSFGDSMLIL